MVYHDGTPRRSDEEIEEIDQRPQGVAAVLPARGVAPRRRIAADMTFSSCRACGQNCSQCGLAIFSRWVLRRMSHESHECCTDGMW